MYIICTVAVLKLFFFQFLFPSEMVVGILFYVALKILGCFFPLNFYLITLPLFLMLVKSLLKESCPHDYGVLVL